MKSKGLPRIFVRLALMLLAAVAIDTAVVLFPIRAWAAIPSFCERGCKDINDCGCDQLCTLDNRCTLVSFPPPSEPCCGIGKRALIIQRFYDCNGDGVRDCECRLKDWWYDPTCP